MEKNPKNSEENKETSEEGGENMKIWLQENKLVILTMIPEKM